ncbi:hypothetical protein U1Q18_040330 [Sarracenia purpurea var. burkii]
MEFSRFFWLEPPQGFNAGTYGFTLDEVPPDLRKLKVPLDLSPICVLQVGKGKKAVGGVQILEPEAAAPSSSTIPQCSNAQIVRVVTSQEVDETVLVAGIFQEVAVTEQDEDPAVISAPAQEACIANNPELNSEPPATIEGNQLQQNTPIGSDCPVSNAEAS